MLQGFLTLSFYELFHVLIYGKLPSISLLYKNYSSLGFSLRSSSSSLLITSSRDFLPRFLTFIISSSDLLDSSSTVLIPALFKQLYDLTDKIGRASCRERV